MKGKITKLILVIAMGCIALFMYDRYKVPPVINAPDITFTTDDGQQDLSMFLGEKTVLVFYASWCGTCLAEMKPLAEARKKFEADGIQIIGLTDDTPELIGKVREKFEVPFDLYQLTGKLKSHGIYTLPTTYILNEKGEVVFEKVDLIDWTDEAFLNEVRELVKS